jgi:Protein of unknown function (DUF3352)
MKKIFVILLAILILFAAYAVWTVRDTGPADAAELLPSETVALASIPDLPRTASRWPKTTLAKIGAEPEMKAFLERPFQYLTKDRGGNEAAGILWNLKPGRIFTAVVSMSSNDAAALVGFQFWGGKSGHDMAVARLREELSKGGAASELARETYHGVEIVSSKHGAHTLYNASQGQWGFLSNNINAIKDAIDRASGRKKEGSLAENPRYKEVLDKLLKDADLLFFSQPQSAVEALLEVGSSLGAQPIPQQVEQLRKVEAVGATTMLEDANLRDRIFVLRRNPPDIGALSHHGMKLTSPETVAYFDFASDFRQISTAASNAVTAGLLNAASVRNSRLPRLFPEAFGPDCAISISWAPDRITPNGLIAIQIKDQTKAEEVVQEALSLFPEASVTEVDGVRYISFPSLQSAFANPTIALVDGFLTLGINSEELSQAMQSFKSGQTLEKSPGFASAVTSYRTANEVFGYVDSRVLFERSFPKLRQVIIFGAAIMPGASEIIDGSKLPETDTIAKHLHPIVYSQTRVPDGYLVESSGPITMNHAFLIAAAAGAAFFKPHGAGQ